MAINKNAKDWPSLYECRFLKDGLVSYEDSGCGINLIKKETIDRMLNSFIGKPVIQKHQEVTPGNFEDVSVGYITDLYFNSQDGWHWCKFLLINDKAKEDISKGYSVSCAYKVTKLGEGGENHAIRYENEILEGEGEHLALVPNPRYEECGVPQLVLNSKGAKYENAFGEGATRVLVHIDKIETHTEGIIYRATGHYREDSIISKDHKDAVAAFNEVVSAMLKTYPNLKKEDIVEEGDRVWNALDKTDPKIKGMFDKEKKEHPEFKDEDIWKIVGDHLRENQTKGVAKMALGEKIKNAIDSFTKMLNEALGETGADEAAEAKKRKEEEERKNAEEAKKKADEETKQKEEKLNALKVRAKNCGLAENATEEEIKAKEEEKAKKEKEEAEKKENQRKENEKKEAEGKKHFEALNSLRETGQLADGLNVVPGNTQEDKLNRGKQLYGTEVKK
jgi:hypothetical protein